MKRNIFLILALLLMGTVQVRAQQVAVVTEEGTTEFSKWPYELAKITFSNGQALFHYDDQVVNVFNIRDIKKIFFYITGAVESMQGSKSLQYSSASEELIVDAAPGSVVAVYQASGARVVSTMHTIASSAISVAHLPAGVYVAVVGGETLKFVKQ